MIWKILLIVLTIVILYDIYNSDEDDFMNYSS